MSQSPFWNACTESVFEPTHRWDLRKQLGE
jgi:hypothetical protein